MGLARGERRGLHLPHVPQAAPAGLGRAPAGTATPRAGGAPGGPRAPSEPPPQGGARPRLPPPRLTGPRGRSCRPRSPAPPVGTGVSPGRGAPSADPPRGARAERRRPTCGSGRSGGSSRSAREADAPTTMLRADGERDSARRAALWRPRPHKPRPERVATPSAPPVGGRSRGHTPDPLARSPAPRGTAPRSHAQREPRPTAPPSTPVRRVGALGVSGRREGRVALGQGAEPGPGRARPVVQRDSVRPGCTGCGLEVRWRSPPRRSRSRVRRRGSGALPASCWAAFTWLVCAGADCLGLPGAGRARAHRSWGWASAALTTFPDPLAFQDVPKLGRVASVVPGPGITECLLSILPGKPGGRFSPTALLTRLSGPGSLRPSGLHSTIWRSG